MGKCLRQDEAIEPLATRLRVLAQQAQRLLNPPAPAGHVLVQGTFQKQGKNDVLAELRRLVAEVETALEGEPSDAVSLVGSLTVTVAGKSGK